MAIIDTRGHILRVNTKDVGDLESLGDISMKRPVKEYKAINTGTIIQAVGNPSVDPVAVSVLYDPADSAGAGDLEAAFINGTDVAFEIELSDIITAGTGNGTTYTWSAVVISDFTIAQEEDGKVLATFTAAVNGMPTVTAAS